jgi:hypothetical protein
MFPYIGFHILPLRIILATQYNIVHVSSHVLTIGYFEHTFPPLPSYVYDAVVLLFLSIFFEQKRRYVAENKII